MTPDQIIKGQTVTLAYQQGAIGILTGRCSTMGPVTMVEVDWGGHREKHDLDALVVHEGGDDDDIRSLIKHGSFGSIEDFQRRITYEKLQGTLTDLFYSMSVAQMDFYPHQFKPVLRFVDSPNSRLLIADEVGLGKTIEAGLIWTECRARFQSRRLLVVCPPMLCGKWVQELRDRFQIQDVREVKTAELAGLLDTFERVGKQLSFHVVCSYRSLLPSREDKDFLRPLAFEYTHQDMVDLDALSPRGRLLARIANQDETTSFADLVVFDEAHVMKNTATATHMAGRIISAASQAVVSLSATPIHNRSRDLFALLQMVDPDFFNDEGVFNYFCQANRPLVSLLNLLGRHNTTRDQVMSLMTELDQSHFLRSSESFHRAKQTALAFEPTPACRMELTAQLEKLNIFDAYINRTRKNQIDKSGRVQRKAQKLSVKLSEKEMALYNAILTYLRRRAIFNSGEATIFHLMNPALRMTSCLPVMAQLLREGRWGDEAEIREVEEAFGDTPEYDLFPDDVLSAKENSIMDLLGDDYETGDSKYRVFRDHLVSNVSGEKIIVFAFFKDTVGYLARRLTSDGLKCQVLTGNIMDMDERRQILEDFENRPEIQILLCSEIAAEGIDLQFCRTIVNYDLPWNPMRVEQRIGRVDRIGQTAKSINIINFCIEDTIDGRIFNHLYNKLEIFRHSIGDLEEIIGQEVSKLARSLLADLLTPDQEVRRIEDAADAIIRDRQLVRQLEDSSEGLVAYRDYLAENIGDSQRLGRFVKPYELKLYMDDFFARNYRGSRLEWDHPLPECGRLTLSYEAASDMEQFCNRKLLSMPPVLCSPRSSFIFTLYPETMKRNHRKLRNLTLVNHMHPLVRWITSGIQAAPEVLHPVSRLSLASAIVQPGWYIYLIQRLTLDGLHKREKLVHGLACATTGHVYPTGLAEELLNTALDQGQKHFSQPAGDLTPVFDTLVERMNGDCGKIIRDYQEEMDSKRRMKISRTEIYYKRRIGSAQKALDTIMNNPHQQERGLMLAKSRLANLEDLRSRKMLELEQAAQIKTAHADVAGGILEVRPT